MNCKFDEEGNFQEVKTGPSPLIKDKLTWNLASDSPDIEGEKREIDAFKRIFLKIGQVIPIKFKWVSNDEPADITITFSSTDAYFKTRRNALAYAFVGTTSQEVDIVFNESYHWVLNKEPGVNRYDAEIVGLHEALHVLGLRHSTNPNSVMYPNYQGLYDLDLEDISRLQSIHGKRSGWARRISLLAGYFRRRL